MGGNIQHPLPTKTYRPKPSGAPSIRALRGWVGIYNAHSPQKPTAPNLRAPHPYAHFADRWEYTTPTTRTQTPTPYNAPRVPPRPSRAPSMRQQTLVSHTHAEPQRSCGARSVRNSNPQPSRPARSPFPRSCKPATRHPHQQPGSRIRVHRHHLHRSNQCARKRVTSHKLESRQTHRNLSSAAPPLVSQLQSNQTASRRHRAHTTLLRLRQLFIPVLS
jgi:hypothetical protein